MLVSVGQQPEVKQTRQETENAKDVNVKPSPASLLKPQKASVYSVCSDLTRVVQAEVDCEDIVTEACDVLQLFEMALQTAPRKTGFLKRSNKTKDEGIQTSWPMITNTRRNILSRLFQKAPKITLKQTLKAHESPKK